MQPPAKQSKSEVALRLTRILGAVAFATAAAGCAGTSESGAPVSVSGDQQGGKVPYAEGKMQAAMEAAQTHCRQFGKKAQITQMSPAAAAEGGGTVGFQCR
jgi:hypothetical protein